MSDGEQIILPEGFTRVEYLRSTGTQYINTNIKPNSETGTYVKALCVGGNSSNNIDGAGNALMTPHIRSGNSAGYCYNGSWNGISGFLTSDIFEGSLNYLGNKIVKLITRNNNFSASLPAVTFSTSNNLHLFNPSGYNYDGQWRIYSYKVTQGTEIILNFIPCLDENNIPCMYDLVSQKPFYNQGSGTFLTPKDLEWNYPPINNNYNLPAGFKKCVYLQSDGTQWINTGVIPDNETGFYFNALQLSYGDLVPFGVQDGGNEIHPPRFNAKNLQYRWGSSNVKMELTWDKADDLIFHSSLNLYNSKIAKFDSEDTDIVRLITSHAGTYTIPIWLFSYNLNGSYNATYGKWVGRIFRAQITQGDALIHDYVPCLDANGRPCMYDIIGGGTVEYNTYYNQSGGTEFAYCVEHQLPSDFIKLKYLEDNGTQFIDTKIVPNNETGLYVDAEQITHKNAHVMGSGHDSNNTGFGAPRFLKGTANTSGFMWKGWISYGGIGNGTRFEGYLNFFNNRKANLKTAGTTERINNLGELGFTPTASIHMFRTNHSSQGGWNGRIYRVKISEGTEIVRDFVPALDERKLKPCMYDLINNVAYYNDGEGEFIYNRDYEGTYKGFTGLGCIGNRLGSDYNPVNEKLPSSYTRIDFLEATGTQYITTDVYATGSMKFELEFLTKDFGGLSVLYGVFKDGEFSCFYNNYNNGYGHAGRFIYGPTYYYPVFTTGQFQADTRYKLVVDGHEVYRNGDKMRYRLTVDGTSNIVDSIEPLNFVTSLPISVFSHTGGLDRNSGIKRMYYFRASDNGEMKINFIPAIDDKGKPCMFDLVTQQPYYNLKIGEDFRAGLKSMSHALQLRLPETGGTITLSLPTNDKIEYYEEKIRANNPNWTITFQYH